MAMTAADIQKLRAQTGAGMMDSKKALEEAAGDFEKAIEVLRLKGAATAAKRSERVASSGLVEAYIHGGRIGALVEVNCETDFVARTDEFKELVKNIAMQVAAAGPSYLNPETVPAVIVAKEREIYAAEVAAQNKPAEIIEKIVTGKLDKYFESVCLIKQPFIKDGDITIEQMLTAAIAKMGENIVIRRFERFELGLTEA